MYLNLNALIEAEDFEVAEVVLPFGTVRLGSISAERMMDFVEKNSSDTATKAEKQQAGLMLIMESLIDGENKRIGDPKLVTALAKKTHRTISTIVDAIFKLNKVKIGLVDVTEQLRAAGKDAAKLEKLTTELASLARRIGDCGTDEVKLAKLLEDLQTAPFEEMKADRKNA